MYWKLQENVLSTDDIEVLVQFIRNTKRFTQFEKVREFEKRYSEWLGVKYSVFVNSGSSANFLLIASLKEIYHWKSDDEIIVPAVTWVTNISPIIQNGLKPIFVDINLDDLSFDYNKLSAAITSRTKAIFVTHLIGFPANIEKIKEIIGNRDIKILEDCCESHGATINNVKIGNFSLGSTFSFYWGHHLTSVEGGMVCTNNEELYKKVMLKRSHGLARELPEKYHDVYKKKYQDIDFNFLFLTDGYNFRNTEFNAVLGIHQLQNLDEYIRIRNKNYRDFVDLLSPINNKLYGHRFKGISSFCLSFIFKSKEDKVKLQRELSIQNIESRPIIGGNLLRQPCFKNYGNYKDFENAEIVHNNGFYIGNNQFVNKTRLGFLEQTLKRCFNI